ncbi:TCR/Tet family MFS transporter [Fretibacter rubidus]|uniref:TCR/Tet family MFS transporter n=1 Tax=Fretibacter rubidus TaxID=570162 RepID=UPI003529F2C8
MSATSTSSPKVNGKNALIFVLLTVVINSIGFGIMIPVLPDLLKELTGLANNEAAIHGGWLTFVFAVMQFICMPIVGALSDRYGRRPIMLLSLFGLSIDYFIMGFAPTIAFLYLGRIIAGAFGATFSTANAYIADISPPETRAQNFGLVGAAFGIGFMLGPVLGGFIGDAYGPRAPFIAAGIISMINVIYGFIFLPETLAPENRRPFKWSRANPFGSLKSLGRIKGVKGLIFVMFALAVAHTVYPSTYAFSTIEGLGWDAGDVGWSLGAFGLASIIVQGGLIRVIIPKIGLFWAGVMGMVSASIAYTGMGLAQAGWVIYAMGPFAAFAGLYNPALNNMMSTRVGKDEQGELQGAIGAAQGLALMIGPLMMTNVFERFADKTAPPYVPGAPFLLAGGLAALSLLIYVLVTNEDDRRARVSDVVEPGID